MNTYKCKNAITIKVLAGDIIELEFPSIARANIVNYTDGVIYVTIEDDLIGKFVKCKIVNSSDYDLIAEIIEK